MQYRATLIVTVYAADNEAGQRCLSKESDLPFPPYPGLSIYSGMSMCVAIVEVCADGTFTTVTLADIRVLSDSTVDGIVNALTSLGWSVQ